MESEALRGLKAAEAGDVQWEGPRFEPRQGETFLAILNGDF